ncbi:MAG: radical SAM-associated putative lipoprotein [Lentimicrobiaceae bacterium]|nr:radical SAM-associated putative lipoprotein [Lentimicrobiaceae bacterium]
MKKPIIKSFDKVILLILGISPMLYACPKYGEPHANYELKGTITNKETSRPIKHIQITTNIRDEYRKDTLYTDSRGQYNYKFWDYLWDRPLHLKFEDIDGEENGGEFITQEMDITFTDADLVQKGKGAWDKGTFVKTKNVELERKN